MNIGQYSNIQLMQYRKRSIYKIISVIQSNKWLNYDTSLKCLLSNIGSISRHILSIITNVVKRRSKYRQCWMYNNKYLCIVRRYTNIHIEVVATISVLY